MARKGKLALYLGVVVSLASATAGYFVYEDFQDKRRAATAAKAEQEAQQKRLETDRQRKEQHRQILAAMRAPVPVSKWLQQRLAPMRAELARSDAPVLVIPPMNAADKAGLDYSSRVVFARALADALAADSKTPNSDPALIFAAAGEPRSMADAALLQLLAGSKVQSVITGSVTVDGGKMNLRLQRVSPQGASIATFEAKDLLVGEEGTPEKQLAEIVPDALRALGFDAPQRQRRSIASSALPLPRSPLDAARSRDDTVAGLWLQQLFGVLHSPYAASTPRSQERVFERSLSALADVSEASADHAVLNARALAYLGRRPAALKVLDAGAKGLEAEALRAYLTADVQSLKVLAPKVQRPVARLISELELFALRNEAGDLDHEARRAEAQRLAGGLPEAWRGLVGVVAWSFNAWDYPSPLAVKGLLERDFDLPDFRVASLAQAKGALGGSPMDPRVEAELTLSPLLHARKWRERNAADACCSTPVEGLARPQLAQYLDLLETAADGLITGQLRFLWQIQGRPEDALARARLFDEAAFGGGHPGVLMEKYLAFRQMKYGQRLPPGAAETLAPELFEDARKVISWVPYQSYAYATAVEQWQAFAQSAGQARGLQLTQRDLPFTGYWRPLQAEPLSGDLPPRQVFLELMALSVGGDPQQADKATPIFRRACELAIHDFEPCKRYVAHLQRTAPVSVDEAIKSAIGDRFSGFGERTVLLAGHLKTSGRSAEAKALLRDALKSRPRREVYTLLAETLRDDGEFDEAVRTYLAFPELKGAGQNTVGLSNALQGAAGELMRRGASQGGRLSEIAASFQDGSKGNLDARAQAALLSFDGPTALRRLQESHQRYPGAVTAGRISSLYFLLGQDEAGWSALSGMPDAASFVAYRAAIVGLRAKGAGVSEALEWARDPKRKKYPWTAIAGFQLLAEDRSPESIDTFFDFELEARGLFKGIARAGNLREPLPETTWYQFQALQATVVGYRELVAGRPAEAARSFDRLSQIQEKNRLLPAFSGPDGYLWTLAYRAYALARAGRAAEAASLLDIFDPNTATGQLFAKSGPKPVDFDRWMVSAVLAASAGDHAKGLQALRLAQARMAPAGERLISAEYAFVEIAEWLAQDSGNRAYLDVALKYARAYQAYEPWTAWAYAFEAKHAADAERRVRASALALRLDSKSRRLQSVPAPAQQRARQWLEQNKPFEQAPPRAQKA